MKMSIEEAQANQTKYVGGTHIEFKVGDHLWLSIKFMNSARLSKTLDYKCTGPYMIGKVINQNANKLDLLPTKRVYNIIQVFLLDPY